MPLPPKEFVKEIQEMVRRAVQKTLDQFWLAYDGIKRAFVDKEPLYARWRNGR